MVDFSLDSEPFLGNYQKKFGTLTLCEITKRAIFSLVIPQGSETKAFNKIKSEFGIVIPPVGKAAVTKDESTSFLRLGIDQLFCLVDTQQDTNRVHAEFSSRLEDYIFTTDQSDVWVSLTLSGNEVEKVLERISPIDINRSKFTGGCVARTTMEHLGTIIYRHSDTCFTLMSASSSAKSFLDAIETSIDSII